MMFVTHRAHHTSPQSTQHRVQTSLFQTSWPNPTRFLPLTGSQLACPTCPIQVALSPLTKPPARFSRGTFIKASRERQLYNWHSKNTYTQLHKVQHITPIPTQHALYSLLSPLTSSQLACPVQVALVPLINIPPPRVIHHHRAIVFHQPLGCLLLLSLLLLQQLLFFLLLLLVLLVFW